MIVHKQGPNSKDIISCHILGPSILGPLDFGDASVFNWSYGGILEACGAAGSSAIVLLVASPTAAEDLRTCTRAQVSGSSTWKEQLRERGGHRKMARASEKPMILRSFSMLVSIGILFTQREAPHLDIFFTFHDVYFSILFLGLIH